MTKERVFPIKISLDGVPALKQQSNRHVTGDIVRTTVVLALNSEFRLVQPVIYHQGLYIGVEEYASRTNTSIQDINKAVTQGELAYYFLLSNLTYIGVHRIREERGEVVGSNLHLYLPVTVKADSEKSIEGVVAQDISKSILLYSRKAMAEQFLQYSLGRV